MLQGAMEAKEVLDLFSGTGALGLEALSRGAGTATFVESDRSKARSIRDNLKRLKLSDRAQVIIADAFEAVRDLSKRGAQFDIIFLDPPYGQNTGRAIVEILSGSPVLREGGIVVLECRKNDAILKEMTGLGAIQSKTYGDTRLVIYRRVRGI